MTWEEHDIAVSDALGVASRRRRKAEGRWEPWMDLGTFRPQADGLTWIPFARITSRIAPPPSSNGRTGRPRARAAHSHKKRQTRGSPDDDSGEGEPAKRRRRVVTNFAGPYDPRGAAAWDVAAVGLERAGASALDRCACVARPHFELVTLDDVLRGRV